MQWMPLGFNRMRCLVTYNNSMHVHVCVYVHSKKIKRQSWSVSGQQANSHWTIIDRIGLPTWRMANMPLSNGVLLRLGIWSSTPRCWKQQAQDGSGGHDQGKHCGSKPRLPASWHQGLEQIRSHVSKRTAIESHPRWCAKSAKSVCLQVRGPLNESPTGVLYQIACLTGSDPQQLNSHTFVLCRHVIVMAVQLNSQNMGFSCPWISADPSF